LLRTTDWTQVLEIQQVLNGYFRVLDEPNLEVGIWSASSRRMRD